MTEQEKEVEEPVPKRVTISNDDLYRRSTQFELWSFTQESLDKAKQKANKTGQLLAQERFNQAFNKSKSENPELFERYKDDELNPQTLITLLTYEEESKFIQFYCQNIVQTTDYFRMPTQVKLTAISLFKKFYLINSMMEYHPKNIMYTSVFLAAKSENYFISIESFVQRLKDVKPSDILDLEFKILQSLKFTLLVHHAFRPLYGFFLDFQAVLLHPSPLMYDVSVDTLGALYDKAKIWLNENAILSDVAFLFTPPQIALAAMYDVNRRVTDRYLKKKFLTTSAVHNDHEEIGDENEEPTNDDNNEIDDQIKSERNQYEILVRTIRKCIRISKQEKPTSEESKEIDKRCKSALSPDKVIERKIKKLTTSP
ncbi:cyclin-like protein [Scheffersomyces coipomensis]|uniref:cyclin-like protein n=1 Tax=Scheffersomyces coipomensis TaxID=1788519 RepID=UPI00315D1A3F